ncbi:MAG: helix-turn-helix domain-containing protein [Muribaculaceae bacterium]|nr:helix-turn-helix domain-containing protein [Muribaculaceae bacterium]
MDKTEDTFELNMNCVEEYPLTTYTDGDIAFLDSINDLPNEKGTIRVNIYLLVTCINGKLQLDIDSKKYTLHANEILLCKPNTMLNNYMISFDFKAKILCLSNRAIQEILYADNDIWNKAFHISENPILHVKEESIKLLVLYNELVNFRLNLKDRAYRKEVISSFIHATIYEVLSELTEYVNAPGGGLIKQGDILFRKFIELLSSNAIKVRFVGWYGEQLCVTPKYLTTVCKQVSGKTANEWITEFILTDIRHCLKYSNKSIKEIADDLDFPNISFFGKYVKAHLGVSPKEYRKRLRDMEHE